jgi:serine/threonine protein kinase
LDCRLRTWRRYHRKALLKQSRPSLSLVSVSLGQPRFSFEFKQSMHERIKTVALGIAEGMQYLHDQNIIHQDLKPDNIGFDADGTVKLFDFGLAREQDSNGEWQKGQVAGSFRYMAPETMKGECSGPPSDVYSFGVLLWQLCTLQRPYEEFNDLPRETFQRKVVISHYRPSLALVGCRATKRVIEDCWNPKVDARPSFVRIWLLLSDICTRAEQKESSASTLAVSRRLFVKFGGRRRGLAVALFQLNDKTKYYYCR